MSRFVECDTCRAKPGTPQLCAGCLANRASIAELEKSVACYAENLGDIVTYGTTADVLDKQLQEWVPRARAAEAKLAELERSLADEELLNEICIRENAAIRSRTSELQKLLWMAERRNCDQRHENSMLLGQKAELRSRLELATSAPVRQNTAE